MQKIIFEVADLLMKPKISRRAGSLLLAVFLITHFTIQPVSGKDANLSPKEFHSKHHSDPLPNGEFTSLVIPLKRAQNLLLVEARINNMTGNFILDTGAPNLVLNKTSFRKGRTSSTTVSAGITGDGGTVYHTKIDSLIIQDLYYTSIDADLVDLGHLEDSKGIKILGLLGANLFSQMEMEIDIRNNVMYLRKLDEHGEPVKENRDSLSTPPDFLFPIQTINNIIFLDGSVSGKKLRFCFDTGAETNVLSTSVSNKVLEKFSLVNRITLGGTSSQKVNVLNGELEELTLGDHQFKNIPFILSGLGDLQEVYNTTVNGILGYYFLSQGRTVINFKKQQLTMYFYKREGK